MHCVDLGESFQTHIYLQDFASIQPRTSPVKFARSSPRSSPSGSAVLEVRKDPDAADLRLWAAYFLAESARAGDLDAFNFCVTKFTVALRSDATFRVMLTKVREVVFGQSAPSGIFGLMSKMLDG